VIGKAVFFTPFRIAAGAVVKMAFLRAHNAAIALGQFGKAGVAVALAKTLFRAAATVNTVDIAEVLKADSLANILVQGNKLLVQWQLVVDRAAVAEAGTHLFKMTGGLD
jgi:flavin-binding protein dodecin